MAPKPDYLPAPLLPAYDAWRFVERMAKVGKSDEPGYGELDRDLDRQTLDQLIQEARNILIAHTT